MKDQVRQDLTAWRELTRHHMPDWRPTLPQLQRLDEGPHELGVALRSITRGWARSDARWDVLMAVLEYYKREHAHNLAEAIRLHYGKPRIDGDCAESHASGYNAGTHNAADHIDPKAHHPATSKENPK
ncbi:hypothetical protein OHB14_36805 [Streptomyces sp. NBC_01613]|uniref:hypothetical protein n=1 Tax=Streptomyces sp. NBC_01613 TaxID=2975896 RepID=UPI00386C0A9A